VALPKTARIGAHTYTVSTVPRNKLGTDEELGGMDPSTNTIRVADNTAPTREIETFIHECLHAMLTGHDFQDEEAIVVILGEGLTSFLADNPSFIRSALHTLSTKKKSS